MKGGFLVVSSGSLQFSKVTSYHEDIVICNERPGGKRRDLSGCGRANAVGIIEQGARCRVVNDPIIGIMRRCGVGGGPLEGLREVLWGCPGC